LKNGSKAYDGPVRPETTERVERWRAMAIAIANKHPAFNVLQIARNIQRSRAGKRKEGLTYSISAIVKYIRRPQRASRLPAGEPAFPDLLR
jgi:hypothetical protein